MKSLKRICLKGAATLGFFLLAAAASAVSAAPVKDQEIKLTEITAKLPLRFEENAGQWKDKEIRYMASGQGYRLSLGARETVFSLGAADATVRLHLAGGAERPALAGIDPLPTRTNYLRGHDPRAWHTEVRSFAGVRYTNVYPGTDLVFSGNERRVEQSFFLAAGAEPRQIRMVYEGAQSVAIAESGQLVVRTPGGELKADRPVAFQVAAGERRMVDCRYELRPRETGTPEVGFTLGEHDPSLPLVIDPTFSSYSLFENNGNDIGHAIAVDGSGNIYIAGSTTSTDFIGTISPGGVQSSNAGEFDGFVMKLDPTATTLLYSTYLGGSGVDEVEGIAVDTSGNAYLVGYTFSTDFPGVTGSSLQSANAGGEDVFVAKLNPAGTALSYSTYLGGTGNDFGKSLAIDGSGNAYLTGSTGSSSFPGVTGGSLQPANAGGASDAFVTKIDAAGTAIVYSTYLGGDGEDLANHIALTPSGEAVITGGTCSEAFPITLSSVAPESPGASCEDFLYDAFLTKLDTAGTALVYSTFLGGEDNDVAQDVAVDASGNAYVTGFTRSTEFTGVTPSSFQPANPGGYAAFVTQVNAAGSATGYSTFLGGNGDYFGTLGWGIAVDSASNAYVTGVTNDGFPVVNAGTLSPFHSGNPDQDGFITKIEPSGAVRYSTYCCGPQTSGYAIAVNSALKTVYVTGSSGPSDSLSAFLIRILPSAALSITKTPDVSTVNTGDRISYTLNYQNYGELDATGATLTETVPDNTVFRPTQSTAGWSCTPDDQAGSTCTLNLGTVVSGASGSAVFTVKVKNNVSANGSFIFNTACAHPGPNCADATTPTTAAPILSITKTPLFNQARPGNVLNYKIKVFNTGNMDADPLVITDTVPGNAVFNPAASTPGWNCTPNNNAGSVCKFDAGNLGTGNQVTVTFAATLSTLYSNTACAAVEPPAPELTESRAGKKLLPVPVCATATTPLN